MDERIKMLISAYHDGELAGEEEAEIRAYIKREEDAQAYLGSLQEISTAISTLPIESAPPQFSQNLISKLELTDQVAAANAATALNARIHNLDDHRAPKSSSAKVIRLRDRSWYPAAVAAILVLSVVGGTILIDKSLENAALERERRLADNPDVTNGDTSGSALERLNNLDGNRRGASTESTIETAAPALPPENAETGDHKSTESPTLPRGEKAGAKSPSPVNTPGNSADGNTWLGNEPGSKNGDGRAVDITKPKSAVAGVLLDDAALRTAIQTNQTVTISLAASALSLGNFGGTLTKTLADREVPLRILDWTAPALEAETADGAPSTAPTGASGGTDTPKSDPASPRPAAPRESPPPIAQPGPNGATPKPSPDAKDKDAPAPVDRESVRRRDTPANDDDDNAEGQPATEAAAVATIFVLGRVTAEDGKGEYLLLDLPASKTADVVRALHDLSGTVNGTFTIDDVLHRVLEGRKPGADGGTAPDTPKRDGESETAKESADRQRPDARTRLVVKLVPRG